MNLAKLCETHNIFYYLGIKMFFTNMLVYPSADICWYNNTHIYIEEKALDIIFIYV